MKAYILKRISYITMIDFNLSDKVIDVFCIIEKTDMLKKIKGKYYLIYLIDGIKYYMELKKELKK